MKIAVCMYYNNGVASYGDYSKEINKMYCKKYNYDFIVANDNHIYYYFKDNHSKLEGGEFWSNIINNTDPYYVRYPLLLHVMENYDWVMWIDADAYFYHDSPPLEYLLYHSKKYDCILSFDKIQLLTNQYNDYDINNGVFIFKNCENNKSILEKMTNSNDIKEEADKNHFIYDQSIFRYLYDTNYLNFKNKSYVLNYGILQHFYRFELGNFLFKYPYIHHVCGKNQNRTEIIKNYYIKIKYFNWDNILTFLTVSAGISFFYYFKSRPEICN